MDGHFSDRSIILDVHTLWKLHYKQAHSTDDEHIEIAYMHGYMCMCVCVMF